jgi:hypothetical protein
MDWHHHGQVQINLSKARFFLVPESQNIYCIVGRFMAVQNHISGVPEGNCVFQTKVATDSRRSLPPISRENCHWFCGKAAN